MTSTLCADELLDLESSTQDFIIETKRLIIPNHPHAFNPSIVRWQGKLFMSFREVAASRVRNSFNMESYLMITELDESFNVIKKPQRIPVTNLKKLSMLDDGRLLTVGSKLYFIYSGNQNDFLSEEGFRLYVAELEYEKGHFYVVHNECLSDFEDNNPHRREKNWVPFDYHEVPLLAYSIAPHKILCPLLNGTGRCETYTTNQPSIVWEWGELRGGTPAIIIDNKYYLSFFHSSIEHISQHSNGKPSLHYYMGAYLFDLEPPYRIKKVSPEPIVGRGFYHGLEYEPYWKTVNVIFPCGLIIENNTIWVSYGRQDHEAWIMRIDKEKLLKSLIRVTTKRD